jgi:hypothetical protein
MTSTAAGADTPMERAVLATVPFLAVGLVASLLLLFVRWSPPPLGFVLAHLTVLALPGFAASLRLAPLAGGSWFEGQPRMPCRRSLASGVSTVFFRNGFGRPRGDRVLRGPSVSSLTPVPAPALRPRHRVGGCGTRCWCLSGVAPIGRDRSRIGAHRDLHLVDLVVPGRRWIRTRRRVGR